MKTLGNTELFELVELYNASDVSEAAWRRLIVVSSHSTT